MIPINTVLVGDGSLLVRCAELLIERGHGISAIATRDEDITAWAKAADIVLVEPGNQLGSHLVGVSCDWLFSIANLSVLGDDILAVPKHGAINFHDGPLPRYAGLNAPAWALMAGESSHGISWHMIENGVDEGDIVASANVDISENETSITLNAKCYAAALDAFQSLIGDLETGSLNRIPQDLSERTYFGRDARLALGGLLEFDKPTDEILRQIRALDFGTYWNPLARPKIDLGNGNVVVVGHADRADIKTVANPGTVLAATEASLEIATRDGVLSLTKLMDDEGNPASSIHLPGVGETLSKPSQRARAALKAATKLAAKSEPSVRKFLTDFHPIALPMLKTGSHGELRRELNLPAEFSVGSIEAIIALAFLKSTGESIADFAVSDAPKLPTNLPDGYVSNWVPVRLNGDNTNLQTVCDNFANNLSRSRIAPCFAKDLLFRDPNIQSVVKPDVGFNFANDKAMEGVALTVAVGASNAVTLITDGSSINEDLLERFARRIEFLAEKTTCDDFSNLTLDHISILPDAERQEVLESWNETKTSYDADQCMHHAFERQVEKTPTEIALVFEDQRVSFAALNARANKVAYVLRDLNISPGTPVGLFCNRSIDLLAGALGILKAGGAYVPLDPNYPADRITHYVSDSKSPVVLTQSTLRSELPAGDATIVELDTDERIKAAPETNLDDGAGPDDLAYLIYTSGSTGTPKGVMVEHRNLANFFVGMDQQVVHEGNDVWLAVTSLSFDIAVLELFYALSRGFKVVLSGDASNTQVADGRLAVSDKSIDFSLFYWGNDDGSGSGKYRLLLEGAKFADTNGFRAVWTPERHFHAFGGPFPNPSVTGAAVAAVTSNLDIRAGSCVVPLHHTARVAEEWAVIDNLTNGRAGLAIASGWQPDDFVLRPENAPPDNKQAMLDACEDLRKLWRGEEVEFLRADGSPHAVVTQPRPVSAELPIWITTAGNPETWKEAGRLGANVLTHLLGQSIEEVADKINIYHAALRDAGHDPADFKVSLMLHTFVADDREEAREIAREPMKDYLRSAAGLIKQYAWAFPAFKKAKGVENPMQIDLSELAEEELEGILDFAFQRYFEDSGLFGTVEDCVARVEALKKIGVAEVACLIDYGIPVDTVLEGLRPLAEVLARSNTATELAEDDFSIAAQIQRHNVTHLQCTPSMARMLCLNDEAKSALGKVRHLMLGGEALSGALVSEISEFTDAQITNMYGPTETTIWSATALAGTQPGNCSIGRPIANTQFYVLDPQQKLLPAGVPGELFIGGDGVTRGYWGRPELTEQRFVPDPFRAATGGARMYRTGDLVRWNDDGTLDFMGRTDHQVKLRGYRIELGEIEARMVELGGVREAVVIAREDVPGDARLVAYVTSQNAPVSEASLRTHLLQHLPEYMVPSHFVALENFPLTPNQKVDRNALPKPSSQAKLRPKAVAKSKARPTISGSPEQTIARVWSKILGVENIGGDDNFFALGGHSLLAVMTHRELQKEFGKNTLAITDIFRFPTLAGLAGHVAGLAETGHKAPPPRSSAAQLDTRLRNIAERRALRQRRLRKAS